MADLLATKLFVPRPRTDHVARPRLSNVLDEGLRLGLPLTLVSAPAGYGKTTLVVDWLDRLAARPGDQPRTGWLSLDADDNEPARFMRYFGAVMHGVTGAAGLDASAAIAEVSLESQMEILINDASRADRPGVLVLDDYHTIRDARVHEAIEFLIHHAPHRLHLVLATREDPPFPLAGLRAHGRMTEIRAADLRFTMDEIRVFLAASLGADPGPIVAEEIAARTEGWAVALQLASVSLRRREPQPGSGGQAALSGDNRYVVDYLVEEVLGTQPPDVRAFLEQTSVLEHFTASLCEAVTGRADSRRLIEYIEHANLFLVALDDHREWYRYHHLFADMLASSLAPDARRESHRRAAIWLADNDLLDRAVSHALASGDAQLAARVLRRAVPRHFWAVELNTVLTWLDALPRDVLSADPLLMLYRAFSLYFIGRYDDVRLILDEVERRHPIESLGSEPVGMIYCLKAWDANRLVDPAAIELATRASTALSTGESFFALLASLQLGRALQRFGTIADAITCLRDAYIRSLGSGSQGATFVLAQELANALNLAGQRHAALAFCEQLTTQFAPQFVPAMPSSGLIQIATAGLLYEANDIEPALQALRRGLDLCAQGAEIWTLGEPQWMHARVLAALGNAGLALEVLQDGRRDCQRSGMAVFDTYLEAEETQLRWRQGDLGQAITWLNRTLPATDHAATYSQTASAALVAARILTALDRPAEALEILGPMERVARALGRVRSLMTIRILQALAHRSADRTDEATAAIEDAVRMAAPGGYRRVFLDEDQAVVNLLPHVAHVAPSFVDDLFDLFAGRYVPPRTVLLSATERANSDLVEPLSARELEVLHLIAQGLTNTEIAERLIISLNTIKRHNNNIFGKLGVANRTQAILKAQEFGLL